MNFDDVEELEHAGHEYASDMNIAQQDHVSTTDRGYWGLANLFTTFAYGLLMLLTRINMTQIESMKRRGPRWIELEDVDGDEYFLDARTVRSVRRFQNRAIINDSYDHVTMVSNHYDDVVEKIVTTVENRPHPAPTPVDWSKSNAMAHAAEMLLAVVKPSPADIVKTPMDEYLSKIAALRNAVDDYQEVPF